MCESTAVSPCPGKCLATAPTPEDCRPRTAATTWRDTRSGSAPKLRTPMTGFSGLLLMSATGAKFMVMPSPRSSVPMARMVSPVSATSSARPR